MSEVCRRILLSTIISVQDCTDSVSWGVCLQNDGSSRYATVYVTMEFIFREKLHYVISLLGMKYWDFDPHLYRAISCSLSLARSSNCAYFQKGPSPWLLMSVPGIWLISPAYTAGLSWVSSCSLMMGDLTSCYRTAFLTILHLPYSLYVWLKGKTNIGITQKYFAVGKVRKMNI